MQHYQTPDLYENAFTCPHCGAYAQMDWQKLYGGHAYNLGYSIDICIYQACKRYSLWQNHSFSKNGKPQLYVEMIYPKQTAIPPAEDMPESIKAIYTEASCVLGDSPRAACALLRLALEELMIYLRDHYESCKNLKGKSINEDIKELVRLGLPSKVQKALDIVRITGNNAVHSTKELDINDNPQIAHKLFEMLNFIVKEMITRPKEIDNLFETMPKGAKEAVKKRHREAES